MKTKFNFVYFTKVSAKGTELRWHCHSAMGKAIIGTVNYNKECNIHYYLPIAKTKYTCFNLLDIYNFVDSLDK